MDTTLFRRLGAVALAAGVAAALTLPSAAAAAPPATVTADDVAAYTSAGMLTALERDLGLAADEALTRLAADAVASQTEERLRAELDGFGGAWIDGSGELTVAVTDPDQAGEVTAAGATPLVVTHTEAELDAVVSGLDRAAVAAAPAADEVYGWHVDVTTNEVVLQVAPGAVAAGEELVEAAAQSSGIDAAAVRVEVSSGAPQTYVDLIGGQAYFPGNSRCSVGFSVNPRGFVTAGHCGGAGTTTRGADQSAQGTVAQSQFPGQDRAYVSVNSNWVPRPWVWRYSGSEVFVISGSQVAAIGAATCRSGSTTGWRCGTITARSQTVNYPQGTVTGLTRTTACAQPGDSGGSFVAANGQAQGVTSGGSGNCSTGGVTFFYPVNPILSAYGLTLVTG